MPISPLTKLAVLGAFALGSAGSAVLIAGAHHTAAPTQIVVRQDAAIVSTTPTHRAAVKHTHPVVRHTAKHTAAPAPSAPASVAVASHFVNQQAAPVTEPASSTAPQPAEPTTQPVQPSAAPQPAETSAPNLVPPPLRSAPGPVNTCFNVATGKPC